MRARSIVFVGIVAVMLVTVACTKKESGPAESAATVADTVEARPSTTEPPTTTTTEGSSSTATQPSTSTTTSGEPVGGCPTQRTIDELTVGMDEAFASGTGDDYIAQVKASLEVLDSYMPPEYDADITLLVSGFDALGEALAGVDFSNPDAITAEQLQRLEAAGGLLDGPALDTSQQRVEDYFATTCPQLEFP